MTDVRAIISNFPQKISSFIMERHVTAKLPDLHSRVFDRYRDEMGLRICAEFLNFLHK